MLRKGRLGLALTVAVLAMVGCDGSNLPIPGLMDQYRHAPSGGKTTLLDFKTPSMPFDNPAKGEASGFAAGNWVVQDGKLQQTQGSVDNLADHLRYTGDAFGTHDGSAGIAYSVSVDCSVAKECDSPAVAGYPTGIMAMIPYYKDPTHYVLLTASGQSLSCWVVNGYRPAGAQWPDSAKVWDTWLPEALDVHSKIRWGADVNTEAHSLTIYVNDQKKVTRNIPMINRDKHWVALAANGNYAQFSNLKLTWTK